MNSTHRKVTIVLKEMFNLSTATTARVAHRLEKHFPTLSLAPLNNRIDGGKLRIARRAKKWTMKRLAKKLDMSPQQLANIEKGRGGTTRQRLIDIADALNIGIEEISA